MTTKAVLQRLTQQAEPHSPPRQPIGAPVASSAVCHPDTNIMRHMIRQTEPVTPPREAPAPILASARPTVHIKQPQPQPVQFEQLEDNTFSALPEHLLPMPTKQPVHPFQQASHGGAAPVQQPSTEYRVTGRKLKDRKSVG